ncbi:lysozyme inhibitor LprI family protein [Bordetella genomosp. 5]|uniref:Lysozyme inhibitor LprI-like N-terminal domain-containing protein n=1 Tax=Bordetella genomosp. 5 TaxID=1395608 RepID=A0A261TBV8_9BORD|nr:lysozyme inhibitor LprI family protein [Bordetella genomosp. 5]OZI46732.1 hypothetical protein CAL25_18780 [Bordetella genomosp. 5]
MRFSRLPLAALLSRAAACVTLALAATPALAIDCAKAQTAPEKLICSDARLKKADAELNRAYADLLKQAGDDGLRTMVRESQRRWLLARDRGLDTLQENLEAGDREGTLADAALEMLAARTDALKAKSRDGKPDLLARAAAQRQFLAKFSGGEYAGYQTSCDVLPPDYKNYACFATRHYQNDDRICSVDEYFATNAAYTHRYVADVKEGKPTLIATCNFSGGESGCPQPGDATGRWNTSPPPFEREFYAKGLPKVDAEIYDVDDHAWLQVCLTDKRFPLADPGDSGETPRR